MRLFPFAVALLLVLLAPTARAQPAALSDEAGISLLTVLPGDEVYSAWGHSAFRVHDPAQGIDAVFNYGTFLFDDPWFVPKFAYGQLDYMLSVEDYARTVVLHRRYTERPMIEQTLALTPAQRDAVWAFLVDNARPENRFYRYHFLRDNCSTRLRDVLASVLGEAVTFHPYDVPPGSYRDLIDRYTAGAPALDLGIDLVLGAPLDEVPTSYEAMFLPDYLLRGFDAATLAGPDGERPLVARTDTVFWIDGYARTAPGVPWPSILTWLLFAAGAAGTWRQARRGARRRWPDVVLFAVVGFAGLVIAFEWFFTLHDVTERNLNLLWAWPTHLAAAAALVRGRARWLRPYLAAAAGAALVLAVGWAWWPQDLPDAMLPVVLLVALRAGRHAYRRGETRGVSKMEDGGWRMDGWRRRSS